jgi:hypothetical protein
MVSQILDSMVLIPIQEGDEKNSEYSEARTRANKRTCNLIIFDNN